MAEGSATQPSRLIRTICLPVSEEQYQQLIDAPAEMREFLDACYADTPELLPEPDCVWTRQGLHPRVFASGARRLVPPLVQSSTGATDAAREPLFAREVLLRKLDRQSVLWPVLLDAKSNGLVSAIGAVFRASGFHSFAACGAHRWPAHRPITSHSVPGVKGTVGEPSSPFRACPMGEASTAGRRPPADLLGSSRRHELPFHSWPSLCHAFYGLASR